MPDLEGDYFHEFLWPCPGRLQALRGFLLGDRTPNRKVKHSSGSSRSDLTPADEPSGSGLETTSPATTNQRHQVIYLQCHRHGL